MLTLSKVEKRHDSGLLVLRGIALEDLIGECEVLLGKLEWESRVVVGLIAVLFKVIIISN